MNNYWNLCCSVLSESFKIFSMKSCKNMLILHVFILFIFSSLEQKMLEKPSSQDEYSEEISSEVVSFYKEEVEDCEDIKTYANCQYKGILVVVYSNTKKGKFFVNDYPNENACKKDISNTVGNTSLFIPFGCCGLTKSAHVLMNVTVYPHNKLLGDGAVSIPVKCDYLTFNATVSHDFPQKKVPYKALTHAIGPFKLTYTLTITQLSGNKNEDELHAEIKVSEPALDAKARNCFAYAKNDSSIKMLLTNELGCSIKTSGFPGWTWDKNGNKLVADFSSFHLLGADKTGMKCDVEACFTESECGLPCPKADSQRRKCKNKP